jgi:tRNA-Thr(GGU) m(6)t(6)A37 methyltransferase TsaA
MSAEHSGRGDVLGLRPIGIIRTRFQKARGTPIQPVYGGDSRGEVWIDEPYETALGDIDGFERVWLLYWLDRAGEFRPRVVPYRDTREHGVLATRSPCRPNPLGLSAVRLLRRERRILYVAGLDVLDGTPLLDLKPYVPEFDAFPASRSGWFENCSEERRTADERFHRGEKPMS